jgi:hypothetical protein
LIYSSRLYNNGNGFSSWDPMAPEIDQLPTDTIAALRDRLTRKGLDGNSASNAIIHVGGADFSSTTMKLFFDHYSGELAKAEREFLATRVNFDASLLERGDINAKDSAALLIRLLENPKVRADVKEEIVELENERDHPRVTVLAAAEAALGEPAGIDL